MEIDLLIVPEQRIHKVLGDIEYCRHINAQVEPSPFPARGAEFRSQYFPKNAPDHELRCP